MNKAVYRILDWDSRWFEIPIGRADVSELSEASAASLEAWAHSNHLRCVYVFVEKQSEAKALIPAFRPMDVRVEYEITPSSCAEDIQGLDVSSLQPHELTTVCSLASRLFTQTRFSTDPHFDPQRVKDLYAEWVRRDYASGMPGCRVVRMEGQLAGFITGRINEVDATQGTIGLLGVAEPFRGRGLARQLVTHLSRLFVGAGVKQVRVVTQRDNLAACRLYESCGGRIVSSGAWYHRWFE